MKYISAEQFLQADKKVQEAILEWWKPEAGDLVKRDVSDYIEVILETYKEKMYRLATVIETSAILKEKYIPLLTEGQLIQFIEDKTEGKIDVEFNFVEGYNIIVYFKSKKKYSLDFEEYGNDLLQALWKVAIEITKEG